MRVWWGLNHGFCGSHAGWRFSVMSALPGPCEARLLACLQEHWGHSAFRPLQAEAVQACLSGHDVLVILPTGGGKSVTYQLPPLAAQGLAVVITPLLALARDQVQAALDRNIHAAMWAGETSDSARTAIKSSALGARGDPDGLRLLYTTPESLRTPVLRRVGRAPACRLQAACLSRHGGRGVPRAPPGAAGSCAAVRARHHCHARLPMPAWPCPDTPILVVTPTPQRPAQGGVRGGRPGVLWHRRGALRQPVGPWCVPPVFVPLPQHHTMPAVKFPACHPRACPCDGAPAGAWAVLRCLALA